MESDPVVPETLAFRQLEQLVRHLGEELATFRKRAQAAEARVRTLEAAVAEGAIPTSPERLRVLEAENAELRARLGHAARRTRELAARVKFIRQQNGRPTGSSGSGVAGTSR